MKVGVPKEIKDKENRFALTPAGAQTLTDAGHSLLVQAGAEALGLMDKFREFA